MPAGTCDPGAAPSSGGIGFCGKLPSHGDFVRRRVPAPLLWRWEEWADAVTATIRRHLADDWPGIYVNSPIWRFAASAHCCGNRPFVGVMMPSVDRVGRYHPLSLLAALEPTACAASVALKSNSWYAEMEAVALSALEDEFRFDQFDARLAAATIPSSSACAPFETARDGPFDRAISGALASILDAKSVPYSLWWTIDSDRQSPLCCSYVGLPTPEDFRDLIIPGGEG
jgi:type VI secretion system protein ImpM